MGYTYLTDLAHPKKVHRSLEQICPTFRGESKVFRHINFSMTWLDCIKSAGFTSKYQIKY